MSTIAQEYIREGREEGREEGLIEIRETITEVLAVRLGVPEETYRAQLNEINDTAVLRKLAVLAATAVDTATFEAGLPSES